MMVVVGVIEAFKLNLGLMSIVLPMLAIVYNQSSVNSIKCVLLNFSSKYYTGYWITPPRDELPKPNILDHVVG